MNTLLAVARDLYLFLRYLAHDIAALFRDREQSTTETFLLTSAEHVVDDYGEGIEETVVTIFEEELQDDEPITFRSTAEIFSASTHPEKNTVMYTGRENTPVFTEPTASFDGVIARLPYGAFVMTLEQRGRWSRIVYRETAGWVLRDELIDRAAYVYPDFIIGATNFTDDPNTLRLRAVISDEFSGGLIELPLQSSEYVLYRLYRKNLSVAWPDVRPRTEGTWHTILGGVSGVYGSVSPSQGAVMEYVREDSVGHLAYVDAVFPDETISISEANYPDNGAYNERVLTREEWRELRPVFISVT
ncbi:hypothetical protein GW943_00885 [Candidatus Parcubacteria bacterium]|uniref:SH3b domain-containing protein n=1 Tax=Candidatus Kaiserbacteria bacterium CG10_big_fil_rev_8_21_14_0_10_47_16 TaxID=1974608 RepID=A0A2H0UDC4_9BACT|nr:hypothetical protein [Candidatus Parcubacteria bacterium]PIR84391.1 MAG: hypothetical protein COU16_02265 [Candidatus Kaiserbacteria bacterium CG10_big_fil_rev_8_21_14_0_10_47_16]